MRMAKRCWCGKTHPRGCVKNGEVRHWVMNWKLYQFRAKDHPEVNWNGHEKKYDHELLTESLARPRRPCPTGIRGAIFYK